MKRNIKNIILVMILAVVAGLTFSCKGMTDSLLPGENSGTPENVQYNGKKPSEAINYVGSVNKIYMPAHTGRFTNGQILPDYMGTGVDARFEAKLVEYDSLSNDVKKYVKDLISTSARHLTYNDLNCKFNILHCCFAI